jgi:hypothetical protein
VTLPVGAEGTYYGRNQDPDSPLEFAFEYGAGRRISDYFQTGILQHLQHAQLVPARERRDPVDNDEDEAEDEEPINAFEADNANVRTAQSGQIPGPATAEEEEWHATLVQLAARRD